ncbi:MULTISPECIES: ABC transporter ATP-binding protein [Exiguobacterium]|uniref:Probable multidrug resistance ABC transporter ATP-binding/permease protein YheI n=1 Tax=Exiguobacterium aurantiacum TaxID=33987 RepID=A0A377FWQ1_9BACL|nr:MULTISPECIES: ABC transporter transmembrane domain-containing protein [Exiguobacterium]STO08994.1 Probable multidrug resistance ABC transporter ATP-binding/permease protein YheI [Exiguobacterium aurantiacum]
MKLIKQLDWFIKRQKRTYIIAIILLIITGFVDMLPPWIIGQAIDAIREGSLTTERLIVIVGSLLGIMVLSYVMSYLWIARLFGTAFLLEKKLRGRFFGHLLRQTPRFYQQHRTGDLMALATNDLKAVERTAGFGVMTLVDSFNMTLIALTIMGVFIDWKLTLAALLPMPLLAWSMNKLGRQIHARFTAAQDAFGVMNDQVVESISGLRVVRSFVQEEADTKKFDTITDDVMAKNMHVAKIDVLFEPVIKLLVGLSYLIGLSFGTYLVFTNDITLGQLVSFNIYLGMLIWPMYAFGELINVVQRGTASLERIEATMNEEPDVVSSGSVEMEAPEKITFKSLTFEYPGANRPSLEDIVLHVSRGETIGIVGPTGAGKTTLLRQLIREYPIDDSLLINGVPISDIKLETVRGWSGYVSQEHLLFSKTVRDNILFGSDGATEAELQTAIRLAAFDTDIEHLENGLDTVVGEQGVMLSGGQKQRLSIARALLKNPEILLLDDSLSAVDAKTEARIIDSVRTSRAEQTTFIVAHRLSAVAHADQILVLQDGRVTERGTHDQLMERRGWYYEQYVRQGETE